MLSGGVDQVSNSHFSAHLLLRPVHIANCRWLALLHQALCCLGELGKFCNYCREAFCRYFSLALHDALYCRGKRIIAFVVKR